jgi:hypothetical protein
MAERGIEGVRTWAAGKWGLALLRLLVLMTAHDAEREERLEDAIMQSVQEDTPAY